MINVAICTPTAGSVKASYCASLVGMMTHFFNTNILGESEDSARVLSYNLIIGSNISSQREQLVDDALVDPTLTHVLFIDDDMGFKPHCLNLALSRRQQVVLANYRRKAPPWAFTARKMDNDGRAIEVPTLESSAGLEAVTFGGFGFCLIEADILRQMKKPRFLNRWVEHQQLYSTEDVPFFEALEGIAMVHVDHELSRHVCHVGDYQYQYDTQCGFDPAKQKFVRPVEVGVASL